MTAEQAKMIIKNNKQPEIDQDGNYNLFLNNDVQRAKGYLGALEGPEVLALLRTVENIKNNCYGDAVVHARIAFEQFKEATKP